jgi:signal transduction histidine kinase
VALLFVIVATLSASGFMGVYAYRGLVKSLRDRATELGMATQLNVLVADARVVFSRVQSTSFTGGPEQQLSQQFREAIHAIRSALQAYEAELSSTGVIESQIGTGEVERRIASEIDAVLVGIDVDLANGSPQDLDAADGLAAQLDHLQQLTASLPRPLQERFQAFHDEVRGTYRMLIGVNWITTLMAGSMVLWLLRLVYVWILRPLGILIGGSRRVAGGDFAHRIELESGDEMAELAASMNDMTARFRGIRDDLDQQVRERTRQVVRSEQMASVGFLAAGVAHEINNPLASIAMCAESLEDRLGYAVLPDSEDPDLLRKYLGMIQAEAFRCKNITEKLLDFSRLGSGQRSPTDLRALVQSVVDLLGHIGKNANKTLQLQAGPPVVAIVNPQEIKQVVLNLIANSLDSVDAGGLVVISLEQSLDTVRIIVSDNGCGMTPDVLKHLFEPFFTRRRSGQGTGLGLSISFRIIDDHGGHLEASSTGPGQGSCLTVTLPAIVSQKEQSHRHQAA